MERKEKVLAYINSKEYIPLKLEELMMVLDVPRSDRDELSDILDALVHEGKIFISKRGRYVSVSSSNETASGVLSCSKRGYFGFVIRDDEDDIFIAGENMADALDGDRVLVIIDKKNNGHNHCEGHVQKVLERGNEIIVGVVYKEKDGYYQIRPDNTSIYSKILVPLESYNSSEIGDRVAAGNLTYAKDGKVYGEISDVLGDEDSLKSRIEGIICSYGIKQTFDEETLKEANGISQSVPSYMTEGREDLRDKLIFTIDGDDAKDFDDAVSLDILENGNYLLGVHIADVSEYVREGSYLDREAYERGTSVYLADRVIPMLPESLSNGICSLNPNEDRLTLSCFMEIDKRGTVVNDRLSKTVICSKERMTYNNVNILLEDGDETLTERYGYMLRTLTDMAHLATILNKKREKRGAIQFDFPESKVIVTNEGEPFDIVKEIRGTSNKMIEEFMLAANETVAEFAYWSEIPFIYRNHEPPSTDKIRAFAKLAASFGISMRGKIDENNPVRPKTLQAVLDEAKDKPYERIISNEMLRSLMKACYSEDKSNHFGLAAKYYCHFTSPIRRYPDLVVHRILKQILSGTDLNYSHLAKYTQEAALKSSDCEVKAENTERDVDKLMKTAYMAQFIGEPFDAVISGVTEFGLFAELGNTVEGLVRLESMKDDYYDFDENTKNVTGRRNGKKYSAGDYVKVVVVKADISTSQIDFMLEKDYNAGLRFEKAEYRRKQMTFAKRNTKKYIRKKRRHG